MPKEEKTETPAPDDNTKEEHIQKTRVLPKESGGPKGPEPTRYGDWEKGGKCVDF